MRILSHIHKIITCGNLSIFLQLKDFLHCISVRGRTWKRPPRKGNSNTRFDPILGTKKVERNHPQKPAFCFFLEAILVHKD